MWLFCSLIFHHEDFFFVLYCDKPLFDFTLWTWIFHYEDFLLLLLLYYIVINHYLILLLELQTCWSEWWISQFVSILLWSTIFVSSSLFPPSTILSRSPPSPWPFTPPWPLPLPQPPLDNLDLTGLPWQSGTAAGLQPVSRHGSDRQIWHRLPYRNYSDIKVITRLR